jgi:NAD+ kinase
VPGAPSDSLAQPLRGQRVGVVAALSKAEAGELGLAVSEYLAAAGSQVVPESRLSPDLGASVAAIVVLGGDGLMMRAATMYPDVPLLGINFGNVGFLALVERRAWRDAVDALLDGRYQIQEGATLQAAVSRDASRDEQGWAINDVVVRGGVRMVDLELYVDNHFVNTYPGDGMIVATPRGSTAYGMAAGGPILTAGVRGFALVPISCHSPIRTPLVVSEQAVIELVLANDREASLILDGRPSLDLRQGDTIRIERGRHVFRLITLESTNFYEAFRTKFNFRIRPDAIPTRTPSRSPS